MKMLILLLAGLLASDSLAQMPLPPASPLVTLTLPGQGIECSGVAIGAHTVLTAKHCVVDAMPLFNGKSCPTDKVVADDGTDNVLVHTCQDYPAWVPMTKGSLQIGEHVSMWGHAGALPWIYRQGYLGGVVYTRYGYPEALSYVFDMTILPGDSGAPIFNDRNEVVCAVSYSWFAPLRGDQLGACFPLKFTTAHLEMIE